MAVAAPAWAQESIRDNSFLMEEGYNQEAGVVQHIHLAEFIGDGSVECTFTQEWPMKGEKNQFSYTFLYSHTMTDGFRFGDSQLIYRFGLLQSEKLSIAPRLTFQLPNAKTDNSRGAIFNLPLSLMTYE